MQELFPRQSSSTLPTSPSSVSVVIPTTSIDSTAVFQTSNLASITSTSNVATLSTSVSLSLSSIPIVTTSSSSTSTSQTTSSTSSTISSTASQTSISSSSSTLSHTALSTTLSSSSVPHSSTTQPLIPSSSQQTTITTAFTTIVNGSPVVTHTTIPSTIPQQSGSSSSGRTAIIAGSAAGGTALLILLLSLAFCARRKQFKRLNFLHAIMLKRKQERSRATFLDGEDLDDIDLAQPPQRYANYDTPWDGSRRALMDRRDELGTRWSDNGSAFRENVWPPPVATEDTRLMDPLANRDDLGHNIDLGRIVDDVMGPLSSTAHFTEREVPSIYRGSMVDSEGIIHSRTASDASNKALLEAAGLVAASSTVPVRSSPLTQPETKPGPESAEQPGEGVP